MTASLSAAGARRGRLVAAGVGSSGKVVAGLHFVSFQARLPNFEVILNRWILNPDFPKTGAGVDALFARGLATIERAAFFVVPPADQRFVGAPMFDPARPPVPGRHRCAGCVQNHFRADLARALGAARSNSPTPARSVTTLCKWQQLNPRVSLCVVDLVPRRGKSC